MKKKSKNKKKEHLKDAISEFGKILKWDDLNESGKKKISKFVKSDFCNGLTCRDLEQFLPCSKSMESKIRNQKEIAQSIENRSSRDRNKMFSSEEIDEFLMCATFA